MRVQGFGLVAVLAFSGLSAHAIANNEIQYTEEREVCADQNPYRNAYFGDLHVHTALSHETWILDTLADPPDAYAFAKGKEIWLPPLDKDGRGTRRYQLSRPLDFAAVTDHGEFLGEVEACVNSDSPRYKKKACKLYRKKNFLSEMIMAFPSFLPNPKRSKAVCGKGKGLCLELSELVWKRKVNAANEAYDRTSACRFTSFPAYEYTGLPLASNQHRNVVFRNSTVPRRPVSYFEANQPHVLWEKLNQECKESIPGCDVLAIPHNSNEANGKKFRRVYPNTENKFEERRQAVLRSAMEPIVEVFQHKGDSECMNGLWGVLGKKDPFCGFEKIRVKPFRDCRNGVGVGGIVGGGCVSYLDYVRFALIEGLKEVKRLGVNPFKLGMTASTDTHNATPGGVREDNFPGHWGTAEDSLDERLSDKGVTHAGWPTNPGGITGVWAIENSRDAIFDAFQRRETFATSGPRIKVRLFGSWSYSKELCKDANAIQKAYSKGVPMGSDLPPRIIQNRAPRFFVQASMEEGGVETPLQRIQIIKGWVDEENRSRYKIYDVAGDPNNGASVDLKTCKRKGVGFESLCTVWTDPDFDPAHPAYYYARVLENPVCRWNTYQCNSIPKGKRPSSCRSNKRKKIQERAWSSPIWYTPMSLSAASD